MPWTPALLAVVYLFALAVQFDKVLAATYLNADTASAPVIGALAGHHSGAITLGDLPWYSTLIFELATRWLPLHRELWEGAPYAMALASIALIADSLRRVSGRLAAALGAAVLICASPALLPLLLSLDDHSPTWFTIALLGWWLVVLERVEVRSKARALGLLAGGVAICFVTGLNVASDALLLVGGLLPLVVAAAIAFALDRGTPARNALLAAGASAVLALIIAHVTVNVMHEHNVSYAGHYLFGEAAKVQSNLSLWWQALVYIGNGNFFGAAVGFTSGLAAACAVVVLASAVGAVRVGWRQLHSPTVETSAQTTKGGRAAHVAFWLAAGVAMTIAFLFSSMPEGLAASRYLVGVLYAVAALVVIPAEHSRLRWLVACGALIYCLGGTIAMARGTATEYTDTSPSDQLASEVFTIAKREHLTLGYAGYWDAAPITWATHLRLQVFPVDSCGATICQFYLHTISGWYRPHPGERTFLLTDTALPFLPTRPPALGAPTATYSLGSATMYVYPYDIASSLGK